MGHLTKGAACAVNVGMKMRFRSAATLLMVCGAAIFAGSCAQRGAGYFRTDLNDDIVAHVSPGQRGPDVTARLGLPYQRVRFDNLHATAWDYLYRDTWGYWVAFSVMMDDDGRVLGIVSRRTDPIDRD